jgi:hypothetical protein
VTHQSPSEEDLARVSERLRRAVDQRTLSGRVRASDHA